MAKNGGKGKVHLAGPLYVEPTPGMSLGAHRVESEKGGKRPNDPLGVTHGNVGTGPGSKSLPDVYSKD